MPTAIHFAVFLFAAIFNKNYSKTNSNKQKNVSYFHFAWHIKSFVQFQFQEASRIYIYIFICWQRVQRAKTAIVMLFFRVIFMRSAWALQMNKYTHCGRYDLYFLIAIIFGMGKRILQFETLWMFIVCCLCAELGAVLGLPDTNWNLSTNVNFKSINMKNCHGRFTVWDFQRANEYICARRAHTFSIKVGHRCRNLSIFTEWNSKS